MPIQASVGQALSYAITGPVTPTNFSGIPAYEAPIVVSYPGGDVEATTAWVSTGAGKLEWVFSCV